MSAEVLRPRDWARLVLASHDCMPRQRARDQQADLAGAEIRRMILKRLIELDPDSSRLAEALNRIIIECGEPAGPVRAISVSVRDDFLDASANPELLAWLMARALEQS